ncbi:TetR/AcrR family transcriptional regulator [Streptomyces sp. P1-3]|uniref:TetR/AcrR family transcriptional regulator n=1 Tax=Streptomyces sp. P1-3 TaxID=3421658 RepID=UPI003D3692E6
MVKRPYHHGDLRSALLIGAERTLREKGAAALALRELAREVGVSHAAPGRHFKDKQALLDALAVVGFERLASSLEEADNAQETLERRLVAFARTYVDFALHNAELLDVMQTRKYDPNAPEELTAAVDRIMAAFLRMIADGQDRGEVIPGDPARVSLVAVATLQGIATLVAHRSFPDAALEGLDEVVHHLVHGLAPR